MPMTGYTGISFPFRLSPQGGVVMTSTHVSDVPHIKESIQQIFNTHEFQRVMEPDIYSTVALSLFEPNDESMQSVLKSRMVDDLERLEDRIEVTEEDITFSVDDGIDGSFLYASINFKVIKYETWYTSKFRMGEITNE